jgi:hypothetical protein
MVGWHVTCRGQTHNRPTVNIMMTPTLRFQSIWSLSRGAMGKMNIRMSRVLPAVRVSIYFLQKYFIFEITRSREKSASEVSMVSASEVALKL